jgi:hypothetical protein
MARYIERGGHAPPPSRPAPALGVKGHRPGLPCGEGPGKGNFKNKIVKYFVGVAGVYFFLYAVTQLPKVPKVKLT